MKQLPRRLTKNYGPLVLWADDLEAIADALRGQVGLSIESDNTEFDSIDELLQESRGKPRSDLTIRGGSPHVSLSLGPQSAYIYGDAGTNEAVGRFHKVDQILTAAQRAPRHLYQMWWYFPAAALTPPVTGLLRREEGALAYAFLVAILVTMFWAGFITLRRYVVIHTVRRDERPGFLIRNKDPIIVGVIAAVIGAALGAVAPKLIDRIWPSSDAAIGTSGPAPKK